MGSAYEPDDWDAYYFTCPVCGEKYHQSGAEPCACEQCSRCGTQVRPEEMYNEDMCIHCAQCESCGSLSNTIEYIDSAGLNLCNKCRWEE